MATTSDSPICGAWKNDGSGQCKAPAGRGTEHTGYGNCMHHGGASPNGEKHGAKLAMADKARELLGEYRDITPHEVLLNTVKVAAVRAQMGQERADEFYGTDDELKWISVARGLRRDAAQIASHAINAGVQERIVRLAERQGEVLAAAFAAAIALADLPDATYKRVLGEYGRQLNVIDARQVDDPLELTA